ncbi:acyltransferase [Vibrio splendidus]|uniref:acyltransferase n=1 Tax=Vibrio splendidus TaxID=29497 RepID=UPI000D34CFE2|nr:acyltransferase [Vibrio splendidus]PTP60926.1 acyltransferase [Vibrio splendidus]
MKKTIFTMLAFLSLKIRGVQFGKNLTVLGFPYVRAYGRLILGDSVTINSGLRANAVFGLGVNALICKKNAELVIGDFVGMSNVSIYSENSITIGKYCFLGAGVKIWDTDFHSLCPTMRSTIGDRGLNAPISIGENCFIGAGSIVLKGVNIGNNVVVGAGSVVTKNIPDNEVWAGNPCRYIKSINEIF